MPLADGDQERVVLAVEPGIGGQVRFEEGPDGLGGGGGRDHAMTRQHASGIGVHDEDRTAARIEQDRVRGLGTETGHRQERRLQSVDVLGAEPSHAAAEAGLHEAHEGAQAPCLDPEGPGRADQPRERSFGDRRQPAGCQEAALAERAERSLDVGPRRVLGEDRSRRDLEWRSPRPPLLPPEAPRQRRVESEQACLQPVARRSQGPSGPA